MFLTRVRFLLAENKLYNEQLKIAKVKKKKEYAKTTTHFPKSGGNLTLKLVEI